MLFVCPAAFSVFIRHERRLSAKGLDPLVEVSLFQNRRFTVGLVMALLFYMISRFT